MRLPDGFVARVEQRHGFGAVTSAETLLFACLGIEDGEHHAKRSVVESAAVFLGSNFLVRACQTISSGGCNAEWKREKAPVNWDSS